MTVGSESRDCGRASWWKSQAKLVCFKIGVSVEQSRDIAQVRFYQIIRALRVQFLPSPVGDHMSLLRHRQVTESMSLMSPRQTEFEPHLIAQGDRILLPSSRWQVIGHRPRA
jgi:hypothetical protein